MSEQLDVGSTLAAGPPQRRNRRWYRRPVLVAALVLVAVAGVVAVVVTRSGAPPAGSASAPQRVTVHGTVIDSMTGRPVAGARVGVAGRSTKTDAAGAFQISGLDPDAMLTIAVRNYAASTVNVAVTGPVVVRLRPLPVRVTVTSALTGGRLPAVIETPDRVRVVATAAGGATIYRVGPGDQVKITAAGYRPAIVRVGADRTVRAGLQVSAWKTAAGQIMTWVKTKKYAATANWVLSPATGYEYYYQDRPKSQYGIIWVDAQVVGENATVSVSVLPYGMMGTSGSFKGGGTPVTIAGQRAWHGTVDAVGPSGVVLPALMGTSWFHSPVEIMVTGDNLALTDKIMARILAALPRN